MTALRGQKGSFMYRRQPHGEVRSKKRIAAAASHCRRLIAPMSSRPCLRRRRCDRSDCIPSWLSSRRPVSGVKGPGLVQPTGPLCCSRPSSRPPFLRPLANHGCGVSGGHHPATHAGSPRNARESGWRAAFISAFMCARPMRTRLEPHPVTDPSHM